MGHEKEASSEHVEQQAVPHSDAPPYFYTAYGLKILSELRIPELETADPGVPDLEVRFGSVPRRGEDDESEHFDFAEAESYLGWPSLGRFLIRTPSYIEMELEPHGERDLLPLPLLGAVMAVLLHKRGLFVLHGSGVSVDGEGVIFLGDKEAGKSTTAAAMVAAGHALLTDDVLAIDFSGDRPMILSAYPSIKLTESASAKFAPQGAALLKRPYADFPKERYKLAALSSEAKTPAAIAYVLGRGQTAHATPLSSQEALMAVMRFSYLVRFGEQLIHGAAAAQHLRHCAAFANTARVSRLQVPGTLDRVHEIPEYIKRDIFARPE